jgi:hypothetical protein
MGGMGGGWFRPGGSIWDFLGLMQGKYPITGIGGPIAPPGVIDPKSIEVELPHAGFDKADEAKMRARIIQCCCLCEACIGKCDEVADAIVKMAKGMQGIGAWIAALAIGLAILALVYATGGLAVLAGAFIIGAGANLAFSEWFRDQHVNSTIEECYQCIWETCCGGMQIGSAAIAGLLAAVGAQIGRVLQLATVGRGLFGLAFGGASVLGPTNPWINCFGEQ